MSCTHTTTLAHLIHTPQESAHVNNTCIVRTELSNTLHLCTPTNRMGAQSAVMPSPARYVSLLGAPMCGCVGVSECVWVCPCLDCDGACTLQVPAQPGHGLHNAAVWSALSIPAILLCVSSAVGMSAFQRQMCNADCIPAGGACLRPGVIRPAPVLFDRKLVLCLW